MLDPPISIFISYARNEPDTAFVDRIEADLQSRGFHTWVDRRKLVGGQVWLDEIEKAIDSRQVLLVMLSDEAIKSDYVKMEYRYAQNEHKLVIPLQYRPISKKIPIDLGGLQRIDFESSYENGLDFLLEALSWKGDNSERALPSKRPVIVTPDKSIPLKRGIPRRTIMLGLGGLIIVGVTGGGLAWLTRSQGPYRSSPTTNPTSSSVPIQPINASINSSGAMFGFDLERSHFNPDEHILSPVNVSRLVQYWAAPTNGLVNSSPAVVNGVVYVGSVDHKLYAFNASTGKTLWTVTTGDFIKSSPTVANGVVYVGSQDFKLYAVDASTGKTLWTADTSGGIFSSPTVTSGVVYVGSQDHKLYAFNASTGKTLWTATTGGSIFSSPTVVNGVVYVGSINYQLYALHTMTGQTLWTATTASGVRSSPAVVNGVVYVGSMDMDSNLYALNAMTGELLWTAPTGGGIFSSPAVANGMVYVGSQDHKLYALNASTGKTLWTITTGNRIFSSPTVANGVVYIGSDDHKLYALNASTGKTLWTAPTGGGIFSSPAVANGMVYVGSDDFKLYAFYLPDLTK